MKRLENFLEPFSISLDKTLFIWYIISTLKMAFCKRPDLKREKMDFEEVTTAELNEWFDGEFTRDFHEKYGDEAEISVVIFDGSINGNPVPGWQRGIGTDAKIDGPEGLTSNVLHKGRFVLRTGLDSSEARNHPELVEPGDFPWEGAGTYRGKKGGASGLNEESDWWVFRRVVDKYWEIRANVGQRGIQASKDRVEGMKYMEGELPPQEWL